MATLDAPRPEGRFSRWGLKKNADEIIAEARDPSRSLKKNLGWLDLTVLGIGAIIGTGIFVLAGVGAARAGSGIILSVAFAGLVCAFVGLCYAELASTIPTSGSAYGYTYATLGELVAWVLGWALVLEYAVGSVAVAIGWSSYAQGLLGQMGIALPAAIAASPLSGVPGAVINLPAVLIVLAITSILLVGVKESARVTSGLVAIKLFIIVFVIAVGFFFLNPTNITNNPIPATSLSTGQPISPVSAVMAGAAIFFFAYIGFDAVSTTAEETRNPKRDLPIGILLSLGITTVLYILAAVVLVGMTGWEVYADPTHPHHAAALSEPFGYAFDAAGLPWAAAIIRAGAIAGITSVLMVLLLGAPRIFFALARDGLFPERLAAVHPTRGTPFKTTMLTGGAVALAAGFLDLGRAAEMTNIGTLFAFALVCIGVVVLRRSRPDLERPFKVPFSPWFPILGAVGSIYLAYNLDRFTHFAFFAWMGIGVIIYALYGVHKSSLFRRGAGARNVAVGARETEVVVEEMR
ncbi:MAG TPA: amino acid permease [Candidatus Thermoplasmatota archaeon]|nr:amino acid permease [Candidatus Thermoplasmatota archaeon]